MRKVWLYYRETSQMDAGFAQEYLVKLKQYAELKGYKVVGQSYDLCDWRDTEHHGLHEAMEAVKGKSADALLVTNFRTLGREPWRIHKIYEDLGRQDSVISTEGEEKYLLVV